MDANRKKELKQQWKQRHPQMGVIAIQCEETGELFVGVSKDIPAEFNRHRFQLAPACILTSVCKSCGANMAKSA